MIQFLAKSICVFRASDCHRTGSQYLLHRISVLALATVAALSIQALDVPPLRAESTIRPNVVLILIDDMGLHDLSVESSSFYQSPNIDRLANEGVRFTQGYATCCVCSPSRASIQLGQFPARHGITNWIGAASGMKWNRDDVVLPAEYQRELPAADITIAEALREAGYATFFAGKWHLGGEGSLPTDHGYDINIGGLDKGSPPGGFFSPYNNPKLADGLAGESLPMRLGKETSTFIRESGEKPFFAMLSFYSVHAPVQTTKELWAKYRDLAPKLGPDAQRFKIDRTLPVRQVQDHPVYAGMIETMDAAVGEVLAAIDDKGIRESTVVIFTSDNGGVSSGDAFATCNLPLRGGKGRQWEGGIREPFYIRYPKLGGGITNDTPVTGADFYPTILELCGLELRPENHRDGESLVPLLKGESIAARPLYWHYPHYDNQGGEPSSIIRVGDEKLIHYYEDGRNELYNLKNDPSEQTDLASQYPDRVRVLYEQLHEWLESVEAKYPQPDPRYDPQRTAQKWERAHTTLKQSLEKNHAAMLDVNWSPDATWWGSAPSKD